MLSYRHAFHAGNFADIHKHIALMLCLESLCKKDKDFSIIDTHAGAGLYRLDDERALKTGETADGVLRLMALAKDQSNDQSRIPPAVSRYVTRIQEYIDSNEYPGSPEIERMFLRDSDCLSLVELHSSEIEILRAMMEREGKDSRVHIHFRDAYEATGALCPPNPRRGLLIMDPSYEVDSDYENTVRSLKIAHKKWTEGIKILWYPLLHHRKNDLVRMKNSLAFLCDQYNTPFVCSELIIDDNSDALGMYGSGVWIIGPPWQVEEQLQEACDCLCSIFKV